ncbi:MAG: pyruvate kinase [Chloroflexi bacterium]|nr:MAG: pyruvate kinase [Chloroflexota bacterium]HEY68019.1 pyruvate kinase [Thermoflexia bacterium]
MPRTKIICTIGPVSNSPEVMRGLIRAGMDVARINFSHGDHSTHGQSIATLRQVAEEEQQLVAVMADLQGPKLRVGEIEGGAVELREGDIVTLTPRPRPGARDEIPVPHPELLRDLRPGQTVLLDDGRLELVVVRAGEGCLKCRVVTGGQLTSHKGINVPGATLRFSTLTPKDREDAQFALKQGVDFFALSFVRRPADVRELRQFLKSRGADVSIIAKIEKPEALSVFDEILAEADGIMVARGDLGVETPAEEVPFHQKRIIHACNQAGKPVITATQMLQTMIENPRPTRAEASDIVNAILDGTDAVMLSGETAVGRYPIEAAETMAMICANAEAHLPHGRLLHGESHTHETITEAISCAAVEIASEVGARAIITATMSGRTARMVARHRPSVPIVAVTPNRTTLLRLTLVWGVVPVLVSEFKNTDEMVQMMVQAAREEGLVAWGDRVVLTAGIPFGSVGETNMLKVHVVGESEEV